MKKIHRLLALVLVFALALSLAVPVTAADEQPDFTTQLLKLLRKEKSPVDSSVYVYPYSQTLDATVIKGETVLLQFKRNLKTPSSDDLFCVGIYKGSTSEFLELAEQGKEPELVTVRSYEMSQFTSPNYSLGMTWTASSKYPVGDYTMVIFVISAYGEVYDQNFFITDLHVVSKSKPATELQLYQVEDGSYFEIPNELPLNKTYCFEPVLYPYANTTDRTPVVTSSRPEIATAYVDAGYVYVTGKGIGRTTITVTCGNVKNTFHLYVGEGELNTFRAVPTKTELCVGTKDQIRIEYSPSNLPVAVDWYTEDSSVVSVNNGVVTAVGPGTACVTAFIGAQSSFTIAYTVKPHDLPEDAPVTERTATKPRAAVGHCSACGQDNVANVITPAIFGDTVGNSWYSDHVDYVYDQGIMNGTGENTFGPDMALSRAMVVTVLYRIAGEPEVSFDGSFTDVPEGTWYSDAIAWASQNHIVNGVGNNRFAPNDSITREQIATVLYRYSQFAGIEMAEGADLTSFPDYYAVASFALEGMSWAVAEELISGTVSGGVTYLSPMASATRAQFATIISRYQQMLQDSAE